MPQHPQTPPQRRSWYSLMADRLIALDRIKVGFREYGPGDTLPQDHPDAAASRSTASRVATDCTRPADRPRRIFFHSRGESW